MGYRKFKADRLFNGTNFENEEAVLITDEAGKVEALVNIHEAGADIEKFKGIISPGLINCHCHLELSHLRNVIPPGTGLINFLKLVVTKRGFPADVIQQAIQNAEKEMYDNGIVAVGDISNQVDAIKTKSTSAIRWHTFVEVLSPTDEKSKENVEQYAKVLDAHKQHLSAPNRSVLTPHAPYTVSSKSFDLINNATSSQIISIHNQEHPDEDVLYRTGGGAFLELLSMFGFASSPFPVTGKSSIQSYLPHFNHSQKIFLIHNTFTTPRDIVFANQFASNNGLSIVYCLCPNANLYIENRLPPVGEFVANSCNLVLGTDSYSSNWQLSIAKEMKALLDSSFFLQMNEEEATTMVLQWATKNGAEALGWRDELGTFEIGKKPGVVLIENDLSASKRLL